MNEPESTSMVLVTGASHDTLGLQPAAGRLLTQADVGNTAPEAQAVAVVAVGAAATVMLLTAIMTGYLPARRAARVDPIEALRAE